MSLPQESGYAALVLDRLALHACGMLGAHSACVLALEEAGGATAIAVAGHRVDPETIGRRLPLERAAAAVAGAGVPVPVQRHGVRRGALVLGTNGGRQLTPRELDLLHELAALVGAALEHHDRRELVEARPGPEIAALVGAFEAADRLTSRHSDHVAALARRVGALLGLVEADLLELELGALLHDVGKVRVPREILEKPGPLDEDEWRLMRLHPLWGAEIVAGIPGLEAVSLVVRSHHERIDGSGYPDELPGERIPLASRVVAVCDAYGAMTTDRPYRAALDPSTSLAELDERAGTQFDPGVVEGLRRAVGEGLS